MYVLALQNKQRTTSKSQYGEDYYVAKSIPKSPLLKTYVVLAKIKQN